MESRRFLLEFFVVLVFGFTRPLLAGQFTLEYHNGATWIMSETLNVSFRSFLNQNISKLKIELPGLFLPELNDQSDFKEVFLASFYPGSEKYKNRDIQCSFVKKVLELTTGEAHSQFSELTNEGQICIPSDMDPSLWESWTESLIHFFWTENWIPTNTGNTSLEKLVIDSLGGLEKYQRPEFLIAKNVEFDGYGWGYSKYELSLFETFPVLKSYFDVIKKYNPNDQEPFSLLGPFVQELLSSSPYGMADAFQPGSKIYISKCMGPADLVELLTHEYGHVFGGEIGENITWATEEKTLKIESTQVHDEGVAEAFAWMILRNLYSQYPEIKFLHIAKLHLFSHFRPEDPHLVGAAALFELFHSEEKGNFEQLKDFARTLDVNSYLHEMGFPSLIQKEKPIVSTVPVIWQ